MLLMTIPLILFLFPLAYSPGPGNMFFAANGARFGFRSTLKANMGYHIATFIITYLLGIGFGLGASYAPTFMLIIRYLGVLYVAYLAWGLIRAGITKNKALAKHASFIDGVVLLIFNPKAYIIIALMFSQFLPNTIGAQFYFTIGWISTVFTLNNMLAFFFWAAIGDKIAELFRNEAKAYILNFILGLMLFIVAVWMAFN
ncbi:lysine transporter LysE [Kiloniella spongiae]|uniref:Lysine transporter LysE n=1 Tax=Kiloniella spongiae TaxID=1489064 RepID=A0A0H2MF45_9PROT|nr:LysE family translocator [Kiloniella spongiae]KLN60973.1 lysine transporter LysE [Kiloniella spongiae]